MQSVGGFAEIRGLSGPRIEAPQASSIHPAANVTDLASELTF
jgi:hypothetical protein